MFLKAIKHAKILLERLFLVLFDWFRFTNDRSIQIEENTNKPLNTGSTIQVFYVPDRSSILKNIQTFLSLRRACDLVQAHIEKTCSNNYVRHHFDVVDSVAQW